MAEMMRALRVRATGLIIAGTLAGDKLQAGSTNDCQFADSASPIFSVPPPSLKLNGPPADSHRTTMQGTRLRRGDWVEIRPASEILETLDPQGRLDGLPFMPEMIRFCGDRRRVAATADRICSEEDGKMRRLADAVVLERIRCDGAAHDGCQRACTIFWKTAWLRKSDGPADQPAPGGELSVGWVHRLSIREGDRYICQSTELRAASRPYSKWDPRRQLADLLAGNVGPAAFVARAMRVLARRLGEGPRPQHREGRMHPAASAPALFQPGARVRVLDASAILSTLDMHGRHRGLSFEPDMLTHCGGRYRIERRVERIILETSGTMRQLSGTVALEGVDCCRCVRASPLYWRHIWLEPEQDGATGGKE